VSGTRVIPLLLGTLVALLLPATASAAVQVTTNADEQDSECTLDCSLRDAVLIAGRTGDVVQVPGGTYVLGLGQLNVANAIIQGAGAGTTIIQAGLNNRAIQITGSATITGVTITGGLNGFSGAGIQVGTNQVTMTLQLSESEVTGNASNTASNGFGGGIFVDGLATLVMTNTTVSGNRVRGGDGTGAGAGIYVNGGGRAELRNSTVSGNVAEVGSSPGLGGGVALEDASTLVMVNVTVAANSAGSGGGIAQDDDGSTMTPPPTMSISDTIVAGNSAGQCSGAIVKSGDYNLSTDASCAFTATGDKQNINPLLGPLQVNAGTGRTPTHALALESPAINAGDPATCMATDQRGIARPSGACDIGAFEYVPPIPPPPPPPPPPPANEQLPPPVAGKSVNVLPKSGTVRIRRPGASRFARLTEGQQVPVGTTVDTLKGRVTLVAAADKQGKTATADFYDGIFKISQGKGSRPITTLTLVEKLTCPKKAGSAIAAAKKKKRRLWGNGSGRFRTKGKHSAATVVGTKWLVEDRCTSTLTRVVRGRVSVRDFVKKKTVIVRKGRRYTARAKK
jgi:hypothetical protein